MKLTKYLFTLALTPCVMSELSFFGNSQTALDDKLAVPGDNPLTYCSGDHAEDILTLEDVTISPNPPLKGAQLTLTVNGTVLEDIAEGAYAVLQVKYGLIRLINTEADLCEQVSNVDMSCPIKKGLITIKKDVELPKEIPPGKYTVFADAYTARPESKKITCLEAVVSFS